MAADIAAVDPLLDRALGLLLARNPPIRAAKRIVDALIEEEHDSTTDDVLLANRQ